MKAHIAAVMGPQLYRQLRFDDYRAADWIAKDSRLVLEISRASRAAPRLQAAVENNLEQIMKWCREAVMAELTHLDPSFDPNTPRSESLIDKANDEHERLTKEIERKLKVVEGEADALMSTRGVSGMSKTRKKVIDDHMTQTEYIVRKAKDLSFCDRARSETELAITDLKSLHVGEARDFYDDKGYTDLQSVLKRINTDRVGIEIQLQAYFDHHSQGASRSESVKVERSALTLPAKLDEGKAGFKLITSMEKFLVGRGNEYWAIMPDLRRMAHDIDPIDHMHWTPPILESEIPMELRVPRADQNKALADLLLSLCSQIGLRSTVLASGSYGAKKVSFQAPQDDGCAIYWVLLQNYHPVDLKQRREIENDLSMIHTKFKSGDPNAALKALNDKVRQAIDISCRIKWDTTGIPLIDTLCLRHPQFTMALDEFRDKPDDPEDSIVDLDKMASKIRDVIKILDGTNTDWNSKRAFSLAKRGDDERDQLAKEVKSLRADLKAAIGSRPSRDASRDNLCQAINCNRKIEKFKKGCGWKLCATCLLGATKDKKNVRLKDKSEWIYKQKTAMKAKSQLREMGHKAASARKGEAHNSSSKSRKAEDEKKAETKKKAQMAKKKRDEKRDDDDDEEPSSYAKRLKSLRNGIVMPHDDDDDGDREGRAYVARDVAIRDAREIIDRLRSDERLAKKRKADRE